MATILGRYATGENAEPADGSVSFLPLKFQQAHALSR